MGGELTLICPHCTASNAVPGHRADHRVHCGRCGRMLFAGKPLVLTEETFDLHTAESDLPVVVDYWAPWSAVSRQLVRLLLERTPRFEPRCRIARVNVEEEQNLILRLRIQVVPSLVVYIRGTERARRTGPMDARELDDWVSAQTARK